MADVPPTVDVRRLLSPHIRWAHSNTLHMFCWMSPRQHYLQSDVGVFSPDRAILPLRLNACSPARVCVCVSHEPRIVHAPSLAGLASGSHIYCHCHCRMRSHEWLLFSICDCLHWPGALGRLDYLIRCQIDYKWQISCLSTFSHHSTGWRVDMADNLWERVKTIIIQSKRSVGLINSIWIRVEMMGCDFHGKIIIAARVASYDDHNSLKYNSLGRPKPLCK